MYDAEESRISIVFVHLNSKLPNYLLKNIETTQQLFPKNNVVLITDQPEFKSKFNIFYIKPNIWNRYENILSHPTEFRNNFWFISIARFFAIEEYMKSTREQVLHIESDVIIASDFPVEKFGNLTTDIAFPIVSNERGIASSIYFRNLATIQKLNKFCEEEIKINPATTDMLILGKYFYLNIDKVTPLPIGPNEVNAYSLEISDRLYVGICNSLSHFGGILDGNDVGLYFFGTDPRNLRGKQILHRSYPGTFMNMENWTLSVDENRNFPYVQILESKGKYKLFSIHATNKLVPLFKVETQKSSIDKYVNYAKKANITKFRFRIFLGQFINYLLKKLP